MVSEQKLYYNKYTNRTKSPNESKRCFCIFMDRSKSFDTVSHHLLLESLEDIGITQNCLQLF